MSKFKLDKNMTLPDKKTLYPFAEMAKGDSFLVRESDSYNRVRSAATTYGSRHGKKFSCRITKDGLRIWRIK